MCSLMLHAPRSVQVSLSANIPAAFNRNVVAQELLGAMKQEQFDVHVDLQMTSTSAAKLKAIIDESGANEQKYAGQVRSPSQLFCQLFTCEIVWTKSRR